MRLLPEANDQTPTTPNYWMLAGIGFLGASVGSIFTFAIALKPAQVLPSTSADLPSPQSILVEPTRAIAPQQIQNLQKTLQTPVAKKVVLTPSAIAPTVVNSQPVPPPTPTPRSQPTASPEPPPAIASETSNFQSEMSLHSAYRLNPMKVEVSVTEPEISAKSITPTAQLPEIPSPPSTTTPQTEILELTLSDVVVLALQNNREIKNAYLERIAQRQDLIVAEDTFLPNFTPEISVSLDRNQGSDRISTNGNLDLGASIDLKIPTGAEMRFAWTINGQTGGNDSFDFDRDGNEFSQNLALNFSQPLLRGAGEAVNRAPVEIARLDEQTNILNLKSTLINTITNAIFSYRDLVRAQRQVEIEQNSLDTAREIVEINRVLIAAGLMAPVDILNSETEVANREVSLLAARNNLEAVRLNLINILDIDRPLNIVPVESLSIEQMSLEETSLKQLAFANRPDYLQATLNLEKANLVQLVAENNRRWDLDLDIIYQSAARDSLAENQDLRAGLTLSREFGDRTLDQQVERSRVNLLQAENNLANLQQQIEIEVTDRIRDVNLTYRQVQLARQARELSENQLEIEREKLRLGRSRIIDVVNFQNQLVQARNSELVTIIAYLNALTQLDQSVGTTLETWQITLEEP